MSTLLRVLLVTTLIIVAVLVVLRPRRIRTIGQKVRLIAYLYVVAVVIGAVLQLAGLRG